jgi:hypothetical protein
MPTFASPMYVLDTLQQRYAVPSERDVGADAHRDTYAPIQLRVIKLAKYWLEHFYWEYFAHDPKLLARSTRGSPPPARRPMSSRTSTRSCATSPTWPLRRSSATLGQRPAVRLAKAALAARCSELDRAHDLARRVCRRSTSRARSRSSSTPRRARRRVARAQQARRSRRSRATLASRRRRPARLQRVGAVGRAGVAAAQRRRARHRLLGRAPVLSRTRCSSACTPPPTASRKSDAVTARQQALIQQLVRRRARAVRHALLPGRVRHRRHAARQAEQEGAQGAWKNVSKKKEARVAELLALASPKKHFKELRAHVAQADAARAAEHAVAADAAADVLLETWSRARPTFCRAASAT